MAPARQRAFYQTQNSGPAEFEHVKPKHAWRPLRPFLNTLLTSPTCHSNVNPCSFWAKPFEAPEELAGETLTEQLLPFGSPTGCPASPAAAPQLTRPGCPRPSSSVHPAFARFLLNDLCRGEEHTPCIGLRTRLYQGVVCIGEWRWPK